MTKAHRFVVTGYLDEVTTINLNTPMYNVVGLDWVNADGDLENYSVSIEGWDRGELLDGTRYFACIGSPTVNHHLNILTSNTATPQPIYQLKIRCRPLDPSIVVSHYLYWIELVAIIKE